MSVVFKARLKIVSDEDRSEEDVKQWLEEYFKDCDLGEVVVLYVDESEDDD